MSKKPWIILVGMLILSIFVSAIFFSTYCPKTITVAHKITGKYIKSEKTMPFPFPVGKTIIVLPVRRSERYILVTNVTEIEVSREVYDQYEVGDIYYVNYTVWVRC